MKDFEQRKMRLRLTLAKELYRRGMSREEILDACKPSPEEIQRYRDEVEGVTEDDDVIDAEFIEQRPVSDPSFWLVSPYFTLAVFIILLAIAITTI